MPAFGPYTGRLLKYRVISAGATITPSAGARSWLAILIGGGGGSGGILSGAVNALGMSGGGASGSTTWAWLPGLLAGTAVNCSIGAAGIAGTGAPTGGGTGGATTLGPIGGVTITAPGGLGSGAVNAAATTFFVSGGATPGIAGVNGTIMIGGGNGEDGIASSISGSASGGNGGNTDYGCGGQGNHVAPGGIGATGTGFGAGGGGSSVILQATNHAGAPGTQGCIILQEFA